MQQQVLSAEIDTANPILTAWSLLLGNVELCLAIIHLSVYFALSMRLLYRHKRRVMDNFSYSLVVYNMQMLDQHNRRKAPCGHL